MRNGSGEGTRSVLYPDTESSAVECRGEDRLAEWEIGLRGFAQVQSRPALPLVRQDTLPGTPCLEKCDCRAISLRDEGVGRIPREPLAVCSSRRAIARIGIRASAPLAGPPRLCPPDHDWPGANPSGGAGWRSPAQKHPAITRIGIRNGRRSQDRRVVLPTRIGRRQFRLDGQRHRRPEERA